MQVEASAIQARAGLARTRISIGAPLLRLRSDEQLVALFRGGNEEAFGVIHDRYRQRLFAYTRQMLPGSRQDAEDALQDVFVRAYSGLRASNRELALRAWLYRVAHNRCIDELRRPTPAPPEVLDRLCSQLHDPIAEAERRESLSRLITDVRRLPEQQRSALLMRELGGMTYAGIAAALEISLSSVKSLLVRARIGLAEALEARDTACLDIRDELIVAHDRGGRPCSLARRHMRDCAGCREFRAEIRGLSRQFAALAPTVGPLGVLANLLGIGSGAGGGAAGGGGVAAGSAAGTGGAFASIGALTTGAGHVASVLAAAVVTAGGAVEVQQAITSAAQTPHANAGISSARSATSDSVGQPSSMQPTHYVQRASLQSAALNTASPARGNNAQPTAPASPGINPASLPSLKAVLQATQTSALSGPAPSAAGSVGAVPGSGSPSSTSTATHASGGPSSVTPSGASSGSSSNATTTPTSNPASSVPAQSSAETPASPASSSVSPSVGGGSAPAGSSDVSTVPK